MTKQILAFLFCFTRELNPYSPLGARTQNPHPPRELKPFTPPLPSPSPPRANSNPLLPPYPLPLSIYPPIPPPTHRQVVKRLKEKPLYYYILELIKNV